ncbi:MAG: helix-turn-helix domain-containing protein [Chloroflexales bacterium]|nr:helix-turn-helix domain-containing protein [Chloroflexales bacterium]
MNRAIPAITERPEALKALLKAERNVKRAQRIQMLYLFASKQARTRRAAAAALGVHRETVGAWLECYESGGLAALLACYVPPGKTPTVTPVIEAELRTLLAAPAYFSSYQAIVDWLWQQHQIRLSYSAVYALVRQKLRVRMSVRRGARVGPSRSS